jgi:hypothetical protein
MRGGDGAKAQSSMLGTCFNMARVMTILGVPVLTGKITN